MSGNKNILFETYYRTIAVDFDGVIHAYGKGWHTGEIYDDPVPGAIEWLLRTTIHNRVCIFSTRSGTLNGIAKMQNWLDFWIKDYLSTYPKKIDSKHPEFPQLKHLYDQEDYLRKKDHTDFNIQFPEEKPSAFISLDDRAIQFTGANFPTLEEIESFKAWWEK